MKRKKQRAGRREGGERGVSVPAAQCFGVSVRENESVGPHRPFALLLLKHWAEGDRKRWLFMPECPHGESEPTAAGQPYHFMLCNISRGGGSRSCGPVKYASHFTGRGWRNTCGGVILNSVCRKPFSGNVPDGKHRRNPNRPRSRSSPVGFVLPWRERLLSCVDSSVRVDRRCIPCKASRRIVSEGRKHSAFAKLCSISEAASTRSCGCRRWDR